MKNSSFLLCVALIVASAGHAVAACKTDKPDCRGYANFSNGRGDGRTYYEIHYADMRPVLSFSLGTFETRRIDGLHTGDKYCQAPYPFGTRLTHKGPPVACVLMGIVLSN